MKKTNNFEDLANILRPEITPTKSVLSGKNGTVAGVNALASSLERGKQLVREVVK